MQTNGMPLNQSFEHKMPLNAIPVSNVSSHNLMSHIGSAHMVSDAMSDNIIAMHDFTNQRGNSIPTYHPEILSMSPHDEHPPSATHVPDYLRMQNMYVPPATQFEQSGSLFMNAPNMMPSMQHQGFFHHTSQASTPVSQFHGLPYGNTSCFQDQYFLGNQLNLPHRPNPNDGSHNITPGEHEMDNISNSFF